MEFFDVAVSFNEDGVVNQFTLDIPPDKIFVGLAAPEAGGGYFPLINLFYPEENLPLILAMTGAMDELCVRPQVAIFPDAGKVEVAVRFRAPFVLSRLQALLDQDLLWFPPSLTLTPHVDLCLIGAADFDQVDAFIRVHREHGRFLVTISRPMASADGEFEGGNHLWKAELYSYEQQRPSWR